MCDNMRDIMLQYCGVRARAHEQCCFPAVEAVHMVDINVLC